MFSSTGWARGQEFNTHWIWTHSRSRKVLWIKPSHLCPYKCFRNLNAALIRLFQSVNCESGVSVAGLSCMMKSRCLFVSAERERRTNVLLMWFLWSPNADVIKLCSVAENQSELCHSSWKIRRQNIVMICSFILMRPLICSSCLRADKLNS